MWMRISESTSGIDKLFFGQFLSNVRASSGIRQNDNPANGLTEFWKSLAWFLVPISQLHYIKLGLTGRFKHLFKDFNKLPVFRCPASGQIIENTEGLPRCDTEMYVPLPFSVHAAR